MHGHRGGGGIVHGFLAAMAGFWLIGGAIAIGVWQDFKENPWPWIREYWPAAALFSLSILIGDVRRALLRRDRAILGRERLWL